MSRPSLAAALACLLATPAAATAIAATPAAATPRNACFAGIATTRGYTLGQPLRPMPTPDGASVLFLRGGPTDTSLGLYQYSIADGGERLLAAPGARAQLSVAEKARRERARMTLTGITDYALSTDGSRVLVAQGGALGLIDLPGGHRTDLPGEDWLAPRLAPDGSAVAAVRGNDLYVIDAASGAATRLTHTGGDTLSNGTAEFAAAEELDRFNGAWWSPDSRLLAYEQADTSGVEPHYIADPGHPSLAPSMFRYPRAGTANARVRLGVIPRAGGPTVWINWDHAALPYLARVVWRRDGGLALVLLDRLETTEVLLAVDPATGASHALLTQSDPAWVNLHPESGGQQRGALDLPYFLPHHAGFLWAAEDQAGWRLELHRTDGSLDRVLTPDDHPFEALIAVDPAAGTAIVAAAPDPIDEAVYRLNLAGGPLQPIAAAPGLHEPIANPDTPGPLTDRFDLADGTAGVAVLTPSGKRLGLLPSHAQTPPALPRVSFQRVGARGFESYLLRPSNEVPDRKYPVILAVYAGPTVQTVLHAPRRYIEEQCLADQGFIVAGLDGRGTPGRGRDFERAIKHDLIDLPLQDQVDGLQALGRRFPEMDLAHVGITGWSFGGYFTTMATIRRPDVFAAGVAGAPVIDWADYDTAYTERYLGLPDNQPAAYRTSGVLTYAAQLQRPLLIIHGLTDDNVYFQNTFQLTQALIKAGKPYNLLLLPGTHQLADPLLRRRVDQARAAFFTDHLDPTAVSGSLSGR